MVSEEVSYINVPCCNFNCLVLQSFARTVTDTNDHICRLAYVERKQQFFNMEDLNSEITRHYTSQAIKQMYVVLLGLDVLGNPFGLVVGVARSVEERSYVIQYTAYTASSSRRASQTCPSRPYWQKLRLPAMR